ncbi:SDR family NAD(P)-dependent oxidoreductase [filamentous cyanobacterium LEGE 11480]|uniref:SDR family NAD(P)-dependent oxidoreductase n=1 Tax=Romeriopsis navalis LEGE 11480 TaxID=2777977 RepID=A0A928VS40_9CYAN|nr:SDR family NAD(P)-dependent oxidoreductase [Romeriopsis navalis]MBE9031961.1 SDR family NAD(P)-dependent oxidoreductase [Romeriopsis navalis LEGE 11480]
MSNQTFGQPVGQVLVVGASQGIGLEFVRQLVAMTSVVQVYAACRKPEQATDLQELAGDRLTLIQMDTTNETQVEQAIAQIKAQTDRLNFVINCVGVLHDGDLKPEKGLRQIDGDRMLQYFQVNSISAILLAKHLVPLFKHDQPSVFASISAKVGSIGDNGLGGWYGYRASKAALNMLMKTTAIEYKRTCPNNIITVLHPGTTDTQLSKPFQRNVPPEKLFSPTQTVNYLLDVIGQLTPADSGDFFSWNGDRLPW